MRRLIALALVLVNGCASAGSPPGGVERHTPPEIVSITPDSGATNVKAKSAQFRFDEVVSDRPSGAAAGLDQLFLISPRTGSPRVSWHRSRIDVRPSNGFRANTAYKITLLPGLVDLRGNTLKEPRTVVFSTGPTFPEFSIPGRVFDWAAQRPAGGAYVEATSRADTTIVYLAAADTTGQFDVGPLPAGEYTVRAMIDQNASRTLDRNEKWDTLGVTVSNTRHLVELDVIERDTTPAAIDNVARIDSLTLRVTFDKVLDPRLPLQPALLELQRADSSQLEITGVQWQAAYDQAQQARRDRAAADSARQADTTRAARPPTPTPATPGARTPPPPPKPQFPPPDKGIVVTVSPRTPIVPGAYSLTARGMRNLLGRSAPVNRKFTVTAAPPRDSTARARPDSGGRPPGRPPVIRIQ